MTPLERLYREHRSGLLNYAVAKVGPDAAEDCLHDAFVRLLVHGLPPDATPGYAVGAVFFAAGDRIRHERLRPTVPLPPWATGARSPGFEDAAVLRLDLAAALGRLTPGEVRGLREQMARPVRVRGVRQGSGAVHRIKRARARLRTILARGDAA